jgi:hypothetical protein
MGSWEGTVVVWHGEMHTGHGTIHGRSGGWNTATTYSMRVELLLSDYIHRL